MGFALQLVLVLGASVGTAWLIGPAPYFLAALIAAMVVGGLIVGVNKTQGPDAQPAFLEEAKTEPMILPGQPTPSAILTFLVALGFGLFWPGLPIAFVWGVGLRIHDRA